MKVLVAYATRHGSTAEIAHRIAEVFAAHGHPADAVPVEDVRDVTHYDAVVLGGAAYMFHWLKPAVKFAHRHRAELIEKPTWLFSSGPLGTNQVDEEGRDIREMSRPREFDELNELLSPRAEQVFYGAYDPTQKPKGLGERITRHMPAARDLLPAGDFRDWQEIEAWAHQIAAELDGDQAPAPASDA